MYVDIHTNGYSFFMKSKNISIESFVGKEKKVSYVVTIIMTE